jgi:hypothetical protein
LPVERGGDFGHWRLVVRRRFAIALLAVTGALVAALCVAAPAAFGADSIYWTTYVGAIRVGNLDGSGSPTSLFTGEHSIQGIALDPAAGKIYWANGVGYNTIRAGNLDGTAAQDLFTQEIYPTGLAVDPTAGKLYWDDGGVAGFIRAGNLDGTGASSLYMNEYEPNGISIDPAQGKLYWAVDNGAGSAIRVGNLTGSGSPQTLFMDNNPTGVAIDSAAGKLYWASGGAAGAIRVGNLDGSGAAQTLFGGENYPLGVAIDPTAGKIYWVDYGSGAIRSGNLDGSGAAQTLFVGETQPYFLALLRSPTGTGAPQLFGGSSTGAVLSCSQGAWAPDLVGAFLYRAPRSFAYQWRMNGTNIAGATSSSYTASAPGSYTCRVTAANQAGSSSRTSAPHVVSGAAPPPPGAPQLTNVSQSQRRWREGNALPQIAGVRPPLGTTFHYTLNEQVSVRLLFRQTLPGRNVRRRCVASTRKHRRRRSCTRTVTRGRLSLTAHAGVNTVSFQGRISRTKKLPPGRYTLVIIATNSAGQRATARLTFTIVRR